MAFAQRGPAKAAPASTVHGKKGGASPQPGKKYNDGRNMARPGPGGNLTSQNAGAGGGRPVHGKNTQEPARSVGQQGEWQNGAFRGPGGPPPTFNAAHVGKARNVVPQSDNAVQARPGGSPGPARPDNSHGRTAPPAAGWKGSGAPRTSGRTPMLKGSRGRKSAGISTAGNKAAQ